MGLRAPRWTALCMSDIQAAGDLPRLHGIVGVLGPGYDAPTGV